MSREGTEAVRWKKIFKFTNLETYVKRRLRQWEEKKLQISKSGDISQGKVVRQWDKIKKFQFSKFGDIF